MASIQCDTFSEAQFTGEDTHQKHLCVEEGYTKARVITLPALHQQAPLKVLLAGMIEKSTPESTQLRKEAESQDSSSLFLPHIHTQNTHTHSLFIHALILCLSSK